MERRWTDDQEMAINRPCGPLLVSAAAGSGKTAVLVERVLRRLSAPEPEGCGVDKLLIVTFTNAAASEMRGKIAAALTGRIAENPASRRLRRQLAMLPQASIGTVHSFCLTLIREHFSLLDLSPNFRVADEEEAALLRSAALERALERMYEQGEKEFLAASEALSTARDDRRFAEAVLSLYDKLQSYPDPEEWMEEAGKMLSPSPGTRPGETVWGKMLTGRAAARLEYGLQELESAVARMSRYPKVEEAYRPAFLDDIKKGKILADAARKGNWNALYEGLLNYQSVRLGAVRKFEDQGWLDGIKQSRDEWKKLRGDLSARWFSADEELAMELLRGSAPTARGLMAAVSAFSEEYEREKRRKKVVDFSDIEHMALALVTEKTEKGRVPSKLAEELSRRYREVLVDEYQDTNGVQDMIFTALSGNGRRLFMVGDVKQSIYRFRMADPDVFLNRYLHYPDAEQASEGTEARIMLAKNFRSRRQVLECVNYIFRRVMTGDFGGISYGEKEKLIPGADYPEPEESAYAAELLVLDTADEGGLPEEELEEKTEKEARLAANRLRALADSGLLVGTGEERHPVRPGDMAILLRSVSGKEAVYKKALYEAGLPCQSEDPGEYFLSSEMLTLMSFLEIIENAAQDVPLISVMRSPVYGFLPEELAHIRTAHKELPFYGAVRAAGREGNEKCARMLRELTELRLVAGEWPVSRLVWKLLTEGGLLRLFGAMEQGRVRQENLLAFYEYARGKDEMANGLSGFLRLVHRMKESGHTIPGLARQGQDGVRILSIHKSKGLEFPVVLLADCAKLFNEEDGRAPVLFHTSMGLGCKCRDERFAASYPTFAWAAVAERLRGEMLEEELRVLYVALTRAREKLILTVASGGLDRLLEKASRAGEYPAPEMLRSARSPALWLLAPLAAHPSAGELFEALPTAEEKESLLPMRMKRFTAEEMRGAPFKTKETAVSLPREAEKEGAAETENRDSDAVREILERLRFRYPWRAACMLPSKVTPAALKGRNRGAPSEEEAETAAFRTITLRQPDLAGSRPLSAAERGSAHHLAMQFIDFSRCGDEAGVREEVRRLKEREILSAAQAEAVEISRLSRFFRSELFDRIRRGQDVRREFKFSLLCPAERFFPEAPSDESLMLQGVVDCFFEEQDGLVLVDFKTDRVRSGGEAEAAEGYRPQLEAYAYALNRITGKPVKEKILYFFETGRTVRIED